MVCVNYNDLECLRDECADGRRLGFTGKQAIHPSQIDVIQTTFVPTEQGGYWLVILWKTNHLTFREKFYVLRR